MPRSKKFRIVQEDYHPYCVAYAATIPFVIREKRFQEGRCLWCNERLSGQEEYSWYHAMCATNMAKRADRMSRMKTEFFK